MIWHRSRLSNTAIERLRAELLTMGIESVRFQLVNNELLMEGWVPSYAVKRLVLTRVASLRYPVRNCLRITPGEELTIVS